MNTKILVDDIWVEGVPTEGERYKKEVHNGVWQEQDNISVVTTPVLPLTNIAISTAQLVGDIYWVQENTPMVITADITLPNGTYMIMAERVVDAVKVVDDARFLAVVAGGQMTINANFKSTGNYLITANRLNRGLDRIGAGVNLSFNNIEFDVYV